MLPRRQIREELFRLYNTMTIPKTKTKGRLPRFKEQDLPAINVTTFTDQRTDEYRTHGDCKILDYQQTVVIELYMPVKENFEDDLDDLEEEFWRVCGPFSMPGVELSYDNGDLTPVKDADTPQAVKLLNFTATYSVDSTTPDVIRV